MENLLDRISVCVERGKVNKESPFPPDMKGEEGAEELTRKALDEGYKAQEVLNEGLMPGMQRVGVKFKAGEIYVPDVLIAAKAMNTAMEHLKPYFISGEVKHKGSILMGTVAGDLHDIGKNLVKMVVEGGGWQVIDLGVDVNAERFIQGIRDHKVKALGLSALLTTTMQNMKVIVEKVKAEFPNFPVAIGGAPVTQKFADEIGADLYSPDPQGVLDYLNEKFT